jgi:small subunit ribosomal protein S7
MLIKRLMLKGKASLASRIAYQALDIVAERTGKEPLEVLELAIRNATPVVEVKARRVGGATYQVPVEVKTERGIALALRWLVQFSRSRAGKTMASKLANEVLDASNRTGSTIRKQEETHKMAEANKAFAHYRY